MSTASKKPENAATAKLVSLDSLMVRPGHNPRTTKDQTADDELIASIKQSGILQPPLVRAAKEPGRFFIVAGHRRITAAGEAGIRETLCLCLPWRPESEIAAIDLVSAIAENLHRKALDPLERARSFDRLRQMGLSPAEIAKSLGINRSYVAKELDYLRLPSSVQSQIAKREISKDAARPLIDLVDSGTPARRITTIANQCVAKKSPKYVVHEMVQAEKNGQPRPIIPLDVEIYAWARTKHGSVDKALVRLRELEEGAK